MSSKNNHTPLLYVIAFLSGFVLMGYEIFGSRVLTPHFGSSIHVWGALLAVFMAGLSLGYACGGRFADKHSGYLPLAILLLIPAFILFVFPVYGKAFCLLAAKIEYDERVAALVASSMLFFIPTAFIGAISPYLIKMKTSSMENVGSGSGSIFAIGTIGSIAGTIFSAFYLVRHMESSKAIIMLGGILMINAIICLILHRIQKSRLLTSN